MEMRRSKMLLVYLGCITCGLGLSGGLLGIRLEGLRFAAAFRLWWHQSPV